MAGAHPGPASSLSAGQNLTPEQWYEGLVLGMGQQLRLEDELEEFWLKRERLAPLQRRRHHQPVEPFAQAQLRVRTERSHGAHGLASLKTRVLPPLSS